METLKKTQQAPDMRWRRIKTIKRCLARIGKPEGPYTYADYLDFDFSEADENIKVELIDGEIYLMGAPDNIHQTVAAQLFKQINSFLEGKEPKVFVNPFELRLFPKSDSTDATVVLPDVAIVFDRTKVTEKACAGVPEFIAEIVSPTSKQHDTVRKFKKYFEASVKEYWVVDPKHKVLTVHLLTELPNEKVGYVTSVYEKAEPAPISILPGCFIDFEKVWKAIE